MGYALTLNYKGVETHQTYLGALFTLIINVIVIFVCADKAVALVNMTDPTVTSLMRPMLRSEVEEMGAKNLHDE